MYIIANQSYTYARDLTTSAKWHAVKETVKDFVFNYKSSHACRVTAEDAAATAVATVEA